jgi:3'(2'), 5'-bisphosphate nucleotidase
MTQNLLYTTAIKSAVKAGIEIMKFVRSDDFEVILKSDSSPVTTADFKANTVITQILLATQIPVLSEEGIHLSYQERKQWTRLWVVDPLDGTKEFVKRNPDFTVNIALVENSRPIFGVIYLPVTQVIYFGSSDIGAYKKTIETSDDLQIESLMSKSEKLNGICTSSVLQISGSRSHVNSEVSSFYEKMQNKYPGTVVSARGSSLKFGLLAEGAVHITPRIGPTYEWDTAAGHAIVNAVGGKILQWGTSEELRYNKENLLNPNFMGLSKNLNFEILY